MNANIPDTGKYFAVGSHYRLQFTITGSVRVRIQVFTVNTKMLGLDSKFRQFALPNAMDMLNRMCAGNQLPRKYFKVYKDFEKIFDLANNQTSGQPLVTFSFHHNGMCEQYLTNPAVGGSNPIDNLAPGDSDGHADGRVWSSRRVEALTHPGALSNLRPPKVSFGAAPSKVSFGAAPRFCPARVCCLGWGTDFDDPCPTRICVCPARPSTESRPVCYEPRRWWAMHSPFSSPNATIQVVSTLHLCVFPHAAL